MIRFLVLALLCLQFQSVWGQEVVADSVRPQNPVQDSIVSRVDTVRRVPKPVVIPDSVRRLRRLRDSLRLDSLRTDSLRLADSMKRLVDSVSALPMPISPRLRPLRLIFNKGSQPSPYGPYVGAYLRDDRIFNTAAPIPRINQLLRHPPKVEWIFYLFCGILLLLSFIRLAFFKYFADLFRVFFNTSMRQKQIREQLSQSPLPSLLLNIFYFIVGGFFVYFLLLHYNRLPPYPRWAVVLGSIAMLAILYMAKYVFITLLGYVFDKRPAAESYLFVVFMVNKILGLFLLPMTILLAYGSSSGREVVITLAMIGLVVLALMRMVRGFQAVSGPLRINILHFMVFVAAFELIPVLLIYRVLLIVIG